MEVIENETEIVESGETTSSDAEEERLDDTVYVFDANDALETDDGAGCVTALFCVMAVPAFLFWYFGWS